MGQGHTIDCSGCGLCEVICPQNCIKHIPVERKSEVFVKGDSCIQCGLCDRVCPLKNDLFHERQETFYKAESLNRDTLKKSASGGIAHELAVAVIESGGVVYGAAWNFVTQRVEHSRAQNTDDLTVFQGSKYVQSIITRDIYKSILRDVKEQVVLFIGTPCEVTAVRSYTKDADNLICIDLICHGVPSPGMLADELKNITNRPIRSISFRDRLNFRLKIDDGQKVYDSPWEDNPYYSLYMHFASLREYCYRCKFACNTRVGDITVGDFAEDGNGYSCVVVSTQKGREWFERIKGKLTVEVNPIELLGKNHAFNQPTIKHPSTDKFSELYEKDGLIKAYRKSFLGFITKRRIKALLGDSLYLKIKKLLGKS